MISVLILEDEPKDLEEMKHVIEYAFRGARVETAEDAAEAHKCILDSRARGLDFDFVIADVIVPADAGLTLPNANSPEWDKMVDDVDRRLTNLILTSSHLEGDLHEVTIISKGPGSTERMVSAMAAHIINRGIIEAFGKSADPPYGHEPDSLRGAGTIPLGRLTRAVYLLWKYLDPQHRDRVRRYFDIVESSDKPGEVESVNFGSRE